MTGGEMYCRVCDQRWDVSVSHSVMLRNTGLLHACICVVRSAASELVLRKLISPCKNVKERNVSIRMSTPLMVELELNASYDQPVDAMETRQASFSMWASMRYGSSGPKPYELLTGGSLTLDTTTSTIRARPHAYQFSFIHSLDQPATYLVEQNLYDMLGDGNPLLNERYFETLVEGRPSGN